MTAALHVLQALAAIHNHQAQPAGTGIVFLLVDDESDAFGAHLAATLFDSFWNQVLLREFMPAADNFAKPFSACQNLHDQSATLRKSFLLIDDVAFFECHAKSFGNSSALNGGVLVLLQRQDGALSRFYDRVGEESEQQNPQCRDRKDHGDGR